MKTHLLVVLAVAPTLLAGCVAQAKYDAATKSAADANAALADAQKKVAADEAQIAQLQSDLSACTGKPAPVDNSAVLAAQLEELRKQKAAADARAALFNDFVSKFKKMIDAGKVSIHVRRGRIVLSLRNDVLFDEGKTDLKPAGQAALKEIAQALKTVASRAFQVSGHTDSFPIKNKDFASNWELSTQRAVVVVKFLQQQGVQPTNLSAAGYAEWDPVANNADQNGRAKNRRIEISLVPNMEELISLPDLKSDPAQPAPAPASSGAPSSPPGQ
jgi:chemotaxis protein MotB